VITLGILVAFGALSGGIANALAAAVRAIG
jgi:hypothetical protein